MKIAMPTVALESMLASVLEMKLEDRRGCIDELVAMFNSIPLEPPDPMEAQALGISPVTEEDLEERGEEIELAHQQIEAGEIHEFADGAEIGRWLRSKAGLGD